MKIPVYMALFGILIAVLIVGCGAGGSQEKRFLRAPRRR